MCANLGTCLQRAAVDGRYFRKRRPEWRVSKKVGCPDPYLKSFFAETRIDSRKHASRIFKPQSKTRRSCHFGETELPGSGKDLAGIKKEHHIEQGVGLPSILGGHRHRVFIVKTITAKPAQ